MTRPTRTSSCTTRSWTSTRATRRETGRRKLGFVAALGLVRALTGVDTAVDAASIHTALSSMPEPVALPLGGGVTFQCGSGAVAFAPAICTTQLLKSTLDKDGAAVSHEVLDVGEFLTLG